MMMTTTITITTTITTTRTRTRTRNVHLKFKSIFTTHYQKCIEKKFFEGKLPQIFDIYHQLLTLKIFI